MKKIILLSLMLSFFIGLNNLIASEQINLSLIPMYGNLKKSERQIEVDNKLIQSVVDMGITRQSAAIDAIYKAWRYFEKNEFENAMRRFNQAWLLDPDNGDSYTGFATLTLMTKRSPREAENYFRLALTKERGSTDRHVNFGLHLIRQNRIDESEYLLKQALEIDPKTRNARGHLSYIRFLRKDYQGACILAMDAKIMVTDWSRGSSKRCVVNDNLKRERFRNRLRHEDTYRLNMSCWRARKLYSSRIHRGVSRLKRCK